jgi:hypothetical protein
MDPQSFDILRAVREAAATDDGLLFGLAAAISGGFMGYLRAKGQPFRARLTEGLTCALLSTAIIEISCAVIPQVNVHYFLPIGIFIGYLGSRVVGSIVYKTAAVIPQIIFKKFGVSPSHATVESNDDEAQR